MRLATRLALAFALVATLPIAAVSPLVLGEVRAAFEAERDHRLEAAVRAVEVERRALEEEVLGALDRVARSDALRELETAPDPIPLAGELMAAAGLDVLTLLDHRATVLSSGHLPARAGDPDPEALALSLQAPGRPTWRLVELREDGAIEKRLALVAARPLDRGGIHLLAGRALDAAFVARLAATAGSAVELLPPAGEWVIASAAPPEPPLALAAPLSLLPAPAAAERVVPLEDEAGEPAARLRLRMGARSLAVAQARIVGVLALFLLASVGLALLLGSVLARRIVRPVEALAAGATTVARGDLDHRVEVRASGEVGELVEAFNQMTADLRRERERAAVAERVAAWREVARRLAHEIKNPLTPIAMSVETLRDAWRSRSPLLGEIFEESSGVVLEEVARLKKIVDEFSRFARLPHPQLEAVAPAELVAPVLALYAAPPPGLDFRADVEEGLERVKADRDQIQQVLLNLLRNAQQALGDRGTIRLGVRAVEGGVAFDVEDDGPGVAATDRERIFEPYFTTRDEGTGLGLAIARRIAEEHGGSLLVEDSPLGGARLRLLLPACPADAAEEKMDFERFPA